MATLTVAQIAYLRDMSGDDVPDTSNGYEVSDAALQAIYDDTAQGDGDLDQTIVWIIRRRLGKAARLVSLSGEFGNAAHNQKFEQLERLLTYWEKRTGLTPLGTISAGTINLGLDTTTESGWV